MYKYTINTWQYIQLRWLRLITSNYWNVCNIGLSSHRNENVYLPSIYHLYLPEMEIQSSTYLITLIIDLFFRVFIDERKTQQNRQERRREKVKKTHESQMSELKRYVQNVRTISLIWGTIIWSSGFKGYHFYFSNETLWH